MLIAQISDCHITAAGESVADRVDSSDGLRRAVEYLNTFHRPVDLVLATGDLVNDGRTSEYDRLEKLLAPLRAPLVALPGNHDDRDEMRARFPRLPPGGADDAIDHVVDAGGCRVVCLDTTTPGSHGGQLTDAQLVWLDDVLGERPDVTTIVAQHHPPIASGIPSMDERYGLDGSSDEAAVIARHPQVAAVVGGHYHRTLHARFANSVAIGCPSTALQLALDLDARNALYCDEPPGLLIHTVDTVDHSLTTYPVALSPPTVTWTPSWAVGS